MHVCWLYTNYQVKLRSCDVILIKNVRKRLRKVFLIRMHHMGPKR